MLGKVAISNRVTNRASLGREHLNILRYLNISYILLKQHLFDITNSSTVLLISKNHQNLSLFRLLKIHLFNRTRTLDFSRS